jgi:hypothetical protein
MTHRHLLDTPNHGSPLLETSSLRQKAVLEEAH